MSRRIGFTVGAVAVLTACLAAWVGLRGGGPRIGREGDRGFDTTYPDVWRVSLGEAKSTVGFPLLVPNHPAANDQNVVAVYVRPGGTTVAMQFPSPGKADVRQKYLEVFLVPWEGGDPSDSFAEDVEMDSAEGKTLFFVEGVIAEGVLPKSPDDVEQANPAFLRFVYQGIDVQISGGDSLDLLVEVAKTIIA